VADIQELLGEAKSVSLQKPSLQLRKQNKIRTIHHSLAIEGNPLDEEQITAILEKKRVLGPQKQIREVQNAIQLYELIETFNPFHEKDLLKAHRILMQGLVEKPGLYRSGSVGIFKDNKVSRMAPPAKQVSRLMGDLFSFLKKDREIHPFLKACIFHYELEFIHPFADGNGRIGRLWQQLLLMQASPIFEYLPVETLIHRNQKKYYQALEQSDLAGDSTDFIEFSLEMILKSLREFSGKLIQGKPKAGDRMEFALGRFGEREFTRKDYLELHKGLSTATASRDLARAVAEKKIKIRGTKSRAIYRQKKV
jgi:Fic family protein